VYVIKNHVDFEDK